MSNRIKRLLGAVLGLGTGTALIAAVRRRGARAGDAAAPGPGAGNSPAKERTAMQTEDVDQNVERVHGGNLPPATGRREEHDDLGAAHTLSLDAAKQARAQRRLARGGKATSGEREGMFSRARPGGDVGVAGSMADDEGREDHNPIGPHK